MLLLDSKPTKTNSASDLIQYDKNTFATDTFIPSSDPGWTVRPAVRIEPFSNASSALEEVEVMLY